MFLRLFKFSVSFGKKKSYSEISQSILLIVTWVSDMDENVGISTHEPNRELLSYQALPLWVALFLLCVNVMHSWMILELALLCMLRLTNQGRGVEVKKAPN